MMFLIFLVVDKVFAVSHNKKLFNSFFWFYNAGVVVTVAMLIWHGSLTVLGEESTAMIAGIAGLGHIFITVGLSLFLVALGRALKEPADSPAAA